RLDHDGWILALRQPEKRDRAPDEHGGERDPRDVALLDEHPRYVPARRHGRTSTCAPSCSSAAPSVTTRSPSASPRSITTSSPTTSVASTMRRDTVLPFAASTQTESSSRPGTRNTLASGTCSALLVPLPPIATAATMPVRSSRWGLSM